MARHILTADPATKKQKRVLIDTDYIRSNVVPVASGAKQIVVTFSSPVPTASYSVFPAFECNDADTFIQTIFIKNKTQNGFTAFWIEATPTANYSINYQTMGAV